MTVARSIFISYRRRDSIDVTGRIYDRLVAQFGLDSVFKDVDAIPFGVDFRKHLEREVSHCPALLAIIGPDWLNVSDAKGNRRLDNPHDWVRVEIETALNRDSVVIPVLVGGAKLPKDTELPESLKGLAYRQSAQVRHDPDFHRDVDRLIQRIEAVFTSVSLASSRTPSPARATSPPYATLIDDLATALAHAKPAQSSPAEAVSRRRWLRLMGLGLVGAGGTLATRKWLPALKARSLDLPQLSALPERLQSALSAPTAEGKATQGAAVSPQHTYTSVTVNEFGLRLYQTNFTTNFYEEVLLPNGDGSIGLPLVAVTGGQFLYGNGAEATPPAVGQLTQTIGTVDSFWMGIFPVTQAQWRAVASLPVVKRSLSPNPSYFSGDDLPVEQVSWHEAVEFCQRLSRYTGQRFRLPEEIEWEFACRAKTTTPFHFGQTLTTELANYDGTQTFRLEPSGAMRGQTSPVGYFQVANDFGLYDMHGNVLEWCADRWENPLPVKDSGKVGAAEEVDATGEVGAVGEVDAAGAPSPAVSAGSLSPSALPESDLRVLRGGSWQSPPRHCQSAFRRQQQAEAGNNTIGFRVLREIDQSQS